MPDTLDPMEAVRRLKAAKAPAAPLDPMEAVRRLKGAAPAVAQPQPTASFGGDIASQLLGTDPATVAAREATNARIAATPPEKQGILDSTLGNVLAPMKSRLDTVGHGMLDAGARIVGKFNPQGVSDIVEAGLKGIGQTAHNFARDPEDQWHLNTDAAGQVPADALQIAGGSFAPVMEGVGLVAPDPHDPNAYSNPVTRAIGQTLRLPLDAPVYLGEAAVEIPGVRDAATSLLGARGPEAVQGAVTLATGHPVASALGLIPKAPEMPRGPILDPTAFERRGQPERPVTPQPLDLTPSPVAPQPASRVVSPEEAVKIIRERTAPKGVGVKVVGPGRLARRAAGGPPEPAGQTTPVTPPEPQPVAVPEAPAPQAVAPAPKRSASQKVAAPQATLLPPPGEGTVPIPGDETRAAKIGAPALAAETGRAVVPAPDGSKLIVPPAQVPEAQAAVAEGQPARVVNGIDGPKPPAPTEAVVASDAAGNEVRTVLTDSAEKTAAASAKQAEQGLSVEVKPATEANLQQTLAERQAPLPLDKSTKDHPSGEPAAAVGGQELPESATPVNQIAETQPRPPAPVVADEAPASPPSTSGTSTSEAPRKVGGRQFSSRPVATGEPGSEGVFPVKDINVDPARFQFKEAVNAKGETGDLAHVQKAGDWRRSDEGVVTLWRDPADGKVYVTDGHQRVNAAQRAGTQGILSRFSEAPTAEAAMLEAAEINLRSGSVKASDAARFFRLVGKTGAELEAYMREKQISPKRKQLRDGRALANLSPDVWDRYRRNEIDEPKAIAIGETGAPPDQQAKLAKSTASPSEIPALARRISEAADSAKAKKGETGLFGAEAVDNSLYEVEAKLETELLKGLNKEKRAYRSAAENQKTLESVGTIDAEAATSKAEDTGTLADVAREELKFKGPLRDAISTAAQDVSSGKMTTADAVRKLRSDATEILSKQHPELRDALEAAKVEAEAPAEPTLFGGRVAAPDKPSVDVSAAPQPEAAPAKLSAGKKVSAKKKPSPWQAGFDLMKENEGRVKVRRDGTRDLIVSVEGDAERPAFRVREIGEDGSLGRERVHSTLPEKKDTFVDAPEGVKPPEPKERDSGTLGAPRPTTPTASAPPAPKGSPTMPDEAPVRRSEIVAQLQKTADVPVRTGRMGGHHNALGFFRVREEVVRLRYANDVSTTAHEAGHALDKSMGDLSRNAPTGPVFDDLVDMGKALYPGKNSWSKRRFAKEGFAELVRGWVDGQQNAKPATVDWLEQNVLKRDRRVSDGLTKAREMAQRWEDQGPEARAASAMHDKPVHETSWVERNLLGRESHSELSLIDTLRARWDDNLMAMRRAEEAGSRSGKIAALGPTNLARSLLRGRFEEARNYIAHGDLWEGGDLVRGQSLADVFGDVIKGGKEKETELYINAMRALDYEARGEMTGIDAADWKHIRDKYGADPEIAKAQEDFVEFQQRLWRKTMIEDAGLDPKYVDKIEKDNPNYAHWERIFEGKKPDGGAAGGIANTPRLMPRRTGSTREFYNVIDTAMGDVNRLTALGANMRIARALGEMGGTAEGLGAWMERIPPDKVPTNFKLERIAKQVEAITGQPIDPAHLDKVLTLWGNAKIPLMDESTLTLWKDGKPVWWQVDPELGRILHRLQNPAEHGAVFRTAAWFARAVKLGATELNPGFSLIANPWKDSFNYLINSVQGNPVKAGVSYARGVKNAAVGGATRDFFKASGAQGGGFIGGDRPSLKALRDESLAVTPGRKAAVVVRHPVDLLQALAANPESWPRIAEFVNDLKRQGVDIANGDRPTEEQARIAGNASQATLDFSKAGEYAKELNQIIPFFNPAIRGLEKMGSMGWHRPKALAIRSLLYVGVPSILLNAHNEGDKEIEDMPQQVKNNYWVFRIPGGAVHKMPKPESLGMLFGSWPERLMDKLDGDKRADLGQLGRDTLTQLSPPWLPPLANVVGEPLKNEDVHTGRPLIPRSLQDVAPEEQYTERTSETARWLGEVLHFPPVFIDQILYRSTGGLASNVVQAAERVSGATPKSDKNRYPVVGRFQTSGIESDDYDTYWKLREKLSEDKATQDLKKRDTSRRDEDFAPFQGGETSGMTTLEQMGKELQRTRTRYFAADDEVAKQTERDHFHDLAGRARSLAQRLLDARGRRFGAGTKISAPPKETVPSGR